jgi:hypothetical protein
VPAEKPDMQPDAEGQDLKAGVGKTAPALSPMRAKVAENQTDINLTHAQAGVAAQDSAAGTPTSPAHSKIALAISGDGTAAVPVAPSNANRSKTLGDADSQTVSETHAPSDINILPALSPAVPAVAENTPEPALALSLPQPQTDEQDPTPEDDAGAPPVGAAPFVVGMTLSGTGATDSGETPKPGTGEPFARQAAAADALQSSNPHQTPDRAATAQTVVMQDSPDTAPPKGPAPIVAAAVAKSVAPGQGGGPAGATPDTAAPATPIFTSSPTPGPNRLSASVSSASRERPPSYGTRKPGKSTPSPERPTTPAAPVLNCDSVRHKAGSSSSGINPAPTARPTLPSRNGSRCSRSTVAGP